MHPFRQLASVIFIIIASHAPAQTATWVGSPSSSTDLTRPWSDDSQWSTGVAPNGPGEVATFIQRSQSPTGVPGDAIPRIEGITVTLDSLSYALPPDPGGGQITSLQIGKDGRLLVQGGGIFLDSDATFGVRNDIHVGPAGEMELAGNARVQNLREQSGSLHIWLGGDYSQNVPLVANLRLSDNANLGSAVVGTTTSTGLNAVTFADNSSAGSSTIDFGFINGGGVVFTDLSTAGTARIHAYTLHFRGEATAGSALLAPSSQFAGSSVWFREQSSAGSSTISLGKLGEVVFADDSDAGTATVIFTSGAASNRLVIRDNAQTKDLTVRVDSGGSGKLEISQASQDVELRTLSGNLQIDLGERSLLFTDSAATPGTLGGKISGSGGITWDRPSTLTLSSPNNDFTGPTRVLQGTLLLDQGRLADLEIGTPASLTGVGQISGSLHNAGIVSPGSSPGTITIGGDYTQTAAGRLDVEITSLTDYDRLSIAGTANLDGTLTLSFPNDQVPVGSASFDFLNAGSITGRFATVNLPPDTSAALSRELHYTATGVRLAVTQLPFASFGQSLAGSSLGGHLDDTLATATGGYRALFTSLNTLSTSAEVAAALEALAPDRYTTLAEDGQLAALTLQSDRERRLAALRDSTGRGVSTFFEAIRRSAGFDAKAGLPEARSTHDGGTAGLHWHNDGLSLGFSLTKESGSTRLDGLGSRAETESLVPAATFQYASDRFFVNLSGSVSRDDHELWRNLVYPGVEATATAAPSGSRTDLGLNVGRTFRAGPWQFTPQAGVLHSRWQTDNFTETGATGALVVRDWSAKSLFGRIGLEVSRPHPSFTPTFSLSWLHAAKTDHALSAGFVSNPGSFYAVPGRASDKNRVQAGLALEKRLGKQAVLTLSASGLWGGEARIKSALSAGLRWEF